MSILGSIARRHGDLGAREVEHLHRLLADWQLLADLNFADLLMFARRREGGFVILAQVRPYPAQTLYHEDMVGHIVERRPRVETAFTEERIVREGDPEWREDTPIREEAIPVLFEDRIIAVVSSEQNLATARTPSQLELTYLQAAGDLAQMVADGEWPYPGHEDIEREISPRVGDGFLRLEADGTVAYASPNAVSAYRRLGVTANMIGEHIGSLGVDEEATMRSIAAGRPDESELEANGAFVYRRFLPITHKGKLAGALGFIQDITELRRRDRMLLLKDATIREIHHRVKNNLQTVASLLRMQSRRVSSPESKEALEESIRRISSIALVHETLSKDSSERVEFDDVASRVLDMVGEGMTSTGQPVSFTLTGSAGQLPSEVATPLALILVELCQNAVEHAFAEGPGKVGVEITRALFAGHAGLRLDVVDDGGGMPPDFTLEGGSNLGLQIVRTLVESELGGRIEITSDGGTHVTITVPVPE
jgi:two-component sensor histidine kinase